MGCPAVDILGVMDPEVRAEFDEIRAILRQSAERMDRAEARAELSEQRMNRRMEVVEKRTNQRMELAGKRLDRIEQGQERFNVQLQATYRLVETGVKLVTQLAR